MSNTCDKTIEGDVELRRRLIVGTSDIRRSSSHRHKERIVQAWNHLLVARQSTSYSPSWLTHPAAHVYT